MLAALPTAFIITSALLFYFSTILLQHKFDFSKYIKKIDDDFISGRSSQGWFTIGCSLYVGAMGTWTLVVPISSAIDGKTYSVLFYAMAMSASWISYIFLAPILRNRMQFSAFTYVDFVRRRFGKVLQVIFFIAAIKYLVVWLSAELIAIGDCIMSLSPSFPPIAAVLSVSVITSLYCALGGFPATMIVDRIQSLVCIALIIICYGCVFGNTLPSIPSTTAVAHIFDWDPKGIPIGLNLLIPIAVTEIMNQGSWQRIFAGKTVKDVQYGFLFAMALIFPTMIILGLAGRIASAANEINIINYNTRKEAESALFLLVEKLPTVISVFVLWMAICLVTSTANYIQTSLVAMLADLLNRDTKSFKLARLIGFLLNMPCIIFATFQPVNIINLFMMGNLITASIVPIVLLSLSPIPTEIGAVCGIVSGLIMIFIMGLGFTGTFYGGITWLFFPELNYKILFTLISVFLTAGIVCITVSLIHGKLKPEIKMLQIDKLEEIKRINEMKRAEFYKDISNATDLVNTLQKYEDEVVPVSSDPIHKNEPTA